jgi:hypothetical protein
MQRARGQQYAVASTKHPTGFGPQAKLCEQTVCCICWAINVITRRSPRAFDHRVMQGYDWSRLPLIADFGDVRVLGKSVPHHEPMRGWSCKSGDEDTLPMCDAHHTEGWEVVRHREPPGPTSGLNIYRYVGIDWRAVRDEMRRRVARETTT